MKHIITSLFILIFSLGLFAQDNYKNELRNLYDLAWLPQYVDGISEQVSSYDITGGNNDGFSGTYSYIRKEGNDLVILDVKGAGIIHRIWTPTPSRDTIQFFFDGEKKPRINMPFIDLFSDNVFPFKAPLCGNEIGGYFCYLPISFNRSIKIVYKGEPIDLKFHQIQYRLLPKSKSIESFSFALLQKHKDVLTQIDKTWSKKNPAIDFSDSKIKQAKISITLHPGEEKQIVNLTQGGRIVGLEFDNNNNLQDAYRQLSFNVNWDSESKNAIELPFHDFFGYAYGQPSMSAFPIGASKGKYYSYLPMPYDESAILNLAYHKTEEKSQPDIIINGTVFYTNERRNPSTEGKLYTQYRREINPQKGKPYLIADIKGKGHYVGTIISAQGLEDGMTLFWEGDDCSIIDGIMKMHGTGSEDYFNGGWYAVTDRWDRGISLPIHGSLIYDLKTSRTGGYRFLLSDKINFNSSYNLTIEHGPENNQLEVDYSSVGFFYADKPVFENNLDEVSNPLTSPQNNILLAQDLTMRLYWYTKADFQQSIMTISSKWEKDWVTDIDFEAIPMVQIDLTGLENGRYKVALVQQHVENGLPFTVWQRTKPVSDWIPTAFGIDGDKETVNIGEIEITEQLKTITLRKKKQKNAEVRIEKFIFTKLN